MSTRMPATTEADSEAPRWAPAQLDASNKPARRWRLDLAYDGKGFHGWAVQDGLRTVQGTLEEWISTVLRTAEPVQLTVAGRTDAGVHARGQVAHLDLARQYDAAHLAERLLRVLPDDVVVRRVSRAPDGFDARFSAIWRHYVYRLWDAGSRPDPLLRGHVVRVRERLDLEAMQRLQAENARLQDDLRMARKRQDQQRIEHAQFVQESDRRITALLAELSVRAAPLWMPKLATATAMASSKLFDAAVKESVADCW